MSKLGRYRDKRLSFDSAQNDCHTEYIRMLSTYSIEVLARIEFSIRPINLTIFQVQNQLFITCMLRAQP